VSRAHSFKDCSDDRVAAVSWGDARRSFNFVTLAQLSRMVGRMETIRRLGCLTRDEWNSKTLMLNGRVQ
jgi:hypothetical protein